MLLNFTIATFVFLYSSALIPVRDELCESATKPALSDKCNIECPKDCKVTGWGPWSECKTTSCSTQSFKREKGGWYVTVLISHMSCMCVMWMSHECHMSITWVSCEYHMGVM